MKEFGLDLVAAIPYAIRNVVLGFAVLALMIGLSAGAPSPPFIVIDPAAATKPVVAPVVKPAPQPAPVVKPIAKPAVKPELDGETPAPLADLIIDEPERRPIAARAPAERPTYGERKCCPDCICDGDCRCEYAGQCLLNRAGKTWIWIHDANGSWRGYGSPEFVEQFKQQQPAKATIRYVQGSNCANGSCSTGSCSSGSCASGNCSSAGTGPVRRIFRRRFGGGLFRGGCSACGSIVMATLPSYLAVVCEIGAVALAE